jgi:rhamnose utilization protein RhaD (predicted bifunctional aldolase and dehydrogenase)/NAD(P)-dependent dehydrogenase (short-subunit alcohol dehydrogenase family)
VIGIVPTRNRWSDDEVGDLDPLGQTVYASRLLGADQTLVLHGGGNTSIKEGASDLFGDAIDVLWVKGSGSDLATIDRRGFVAVDRRRVARLAQLTTLSDLEMELELRRSQLDPGAPCPSVEAMTHAVIPDTSVMHTHADALLAIANTKDGAERIRGLYGDRVIVVPYARSGFKIGREAALAHEERRTATTVGMVLMNHGLFTFGPSPREAYDRMITLVTEAEAYLVENAGPSHSASMGVESAFFDRVAFAELRLQVSNAAGLPCILTRHDDPESWAFAHRHDVAEIAGRGPATPDHVIWTKYRPLIGRDVGGYAGWYLDYFEANLERNPDARMLDPAPRVVIDEEFGLITAGPDVRAADVAGDIYGRTMWIMDRADSIGGYEALPSADIFDLEYWELEQAKLATSGGRGEFSGEVAIVTGAASGIGRACAVALLDHGAAVIGLDRSPAVVETAETSAYFGIECDLTSATETSRALDHGLERFGGVDMLVASAGLFPESSPIAEHDPVAWRRAMSVNVDALVELLAAVHPLLLRSPRGGRVAVIGSKNVAAPGPGASAYSASKTAANQIARVAALEWAPEGIRVNSVHPDAVFDTGLWTDELLASRAAKYGMSIEDYKRRNLLGVEITSADVADVVVATLGSGFRTVTGAHIPIDGGNERVI